MQPGRPVTVVPKLQLVDLPATSAASAALSQSKLPAPVVPRLRFGEADGVLQRDGEHINVAGRDAVNYGTTESSIPPCGGGKTEFDIGLDRTSGKPLGVDVDLQDGTSLYIAGVHAGLVEEWNSANPEMKVQRGDCIVEVNGLRSNAFRLADECMKAQLLRLRVRR